VALRSSHAAKTANVKYPFWKQAEEIPRWYSLTARRAAASKPTGRPQTDRPRR
jgi:hypothetical protein